jgi:hypothetical protein
MSNLLWRVKDIIFDLVCLLFRYTRIFYVLLSEMSILQPNRSVGQ